MAQLQVLLKGENWKRRIVVYVLLFVIALVILEAWFPGTIASIFPTMKKIVAGIYKYGSEVMESLKKLVQNISGWNH